jgi:hypothetical protein
VALVTGDPQGLGAIWVWFDTSSHSDWRAPSGMPSFWVSKQSGGPGDAGCPAWLASPLVAELPVGKRSADPASPAGVVQRLGREAGSFTRPGPHCNSRWRAGHGVQPWPPPRHEGQPAGGSMPLRPRRLMNSRPVGMSGHGLFTLACIHPAPLNIATALHAEWMHAVSHRSGGGGRTGLESAGLVSAAR